VKEIGGGRFAVSTHCAVPQSEVWNHSTLRVVRKPHPERSGVSRNCFGRKGFRQLREKDSNLRPAG
jgi:hypothetical protein